MSYGFGVRAGLPQRGWAVRCGLLDALVAVDSEVAELFFDAEELVVLSHTVGTAERTGLDLTRVRSYSDVSDRSIFRLTRAV